MEQIDWESLLDPKMNAGAIMDELAKALVAAIESLKYVIENGTTEESFTATALLFEFTFTLFGPREGEE